MSYLLVFFYVVCSDGYGRVFARCRASEMKGDK